MTPIHFLQAADGTPMTKRYRMTEEGLQKESYPNVYLVTSHEGKCTSIEDFHQALTAHAEKGHCLLKGTLDRALNSESRAGRTASHTPTDWAVLDNDNLHDLEPQVLMDMLGLGDVDYIVQYSSSAGIEPGKRCYHIFFLLDKPWSPSDLKLWLRTSNLDHREIREHFQLSRTKNSLRWPLDISVCQNDKLIYIAPPMLGPGVEDTLEGDRIQLVKGSLRRAILHPALETDETLCRRENEERNRLRTQAGLPAKEFKTRSIGEVVVATNPDQAQITGLKQERDFVYLNLNGGDSWGYYHPIAAPDVLYNFKGEPYYLIKELLPDYYPEAKERTVKARETQQMERRRADMAAQTQRMEEAIAQGGKFLMPFRDLQTDQYHVGWIDPQDRSHELHPIGTKGRINDLMVQHDYGRVEIIPSIDFRFEPANDALYDQDVGFINRYIPSQYLKTAERKEGAEISPAIQRVIQHALGDDAGVVEHFINWFAVIFKYRIPTQTAWILQGTTGTGKGLLFSKIIRPLIGDDYCRMVNLANLANLEEQFNGFAEQSIVLFVDEVDTDQVKDMPKLMARFKSWITEPKLPLRAMRQDLREVPNHLNLILSSNQPNSMRIEANDRRFNVCPRQEGKLLAPDESGEELVAQIERELPDFADYLMTREADKSKARRALDNESKRLLQAVTQTAIEEVAEALRQGDLQYFIEHRPTTRNFGSGKFNGTHIDPIDIYRKVLVSAFDTVDEGTKHILTHEQLYVVFELLVGDIPTTKTKLTKRLGHQHLNIKPHRLDKSSVRGLRVRWQAHPEQIEAWRTLIEEESRPINEKLKEEIDTDGIKQ